MFHDLKKFKIVLRIGSNILYFVYRIRIWVGNTFFPDSDHWFTIVFLIIIRYLNCFKIKLALFLYNRPNSGYGRSVLNPKRFISAPDPGVRLIRDPDPDQDSDWTSIFWAKNLEIVKNTLYSIQSKIRINQLVSHLKEQSKERFCMQLKQRNK